jgi:hypothetical protein
MTTNSYELAVEARDAAEHNFTAGNHQTASTQALLAMMRLQFAQAEPPRITVNVVPTAIDNAEAARIAHAAATTFQLRKPTVSSAPLPVDPGVYQDSRGLPWWRSAVENDKPWLSITHGHSDERWFTEEEAAKHAPFTRMVAAA